jgi:hypothetical protein
LDEIRDLILQEITEVLAGNAMDTAHVAQTNKMIAKIREFDEPPKPNLAVPNELKR